jgi:hypothetical protein
VHTGWLADHSFNASGSWVVITALFGQEIWGGRMPGARHVQAREPRAAGSQGVQWRLTSWTTDTRVVHCRESPVVSVAVNVTVVLPTG